MTLEVNKKIEDFFSKYSTKELAKGGMLIFANEDPEYVFHLLKGRIRQYDISSQGSKLVVNIFKSPAFFPMSWAINRTPNQYFYEAITDVTLKQAPPEDVITFLKENPDVVFDLLARVYRGTDGLLARLSHLMGGSAKSRLLLELMIAHHRYSQLQPDGDYFIDINESQLAEYTGLTRETVNREMRGLIDSGLVGVSRQGIVLKDVAQLEKLLSEGI